MITKTEILCWNGRGKKPILGSKKWM